MRHHSGPASPRRLAGLLLLLAGLAACGGDEREAAPEVVIRGTDPTGGQLAGRVAPAAPVAAADVRGVVTYDTYQAVAARGGETVADIAQRLGLSASELAAYNGLTPAHELRGGEELVLPARPGGYDSGTALAAAEPAPSVVTTFQPAASRIETEPLPGAERTSEPSPVEPAPIELAPVELAAAEPEAIGGEAAPAGRARAEAWSPDLAAAAIARSSGLDPDGTLGAPPSAADPVPESPPERRELQSPGLGQYQTGATGSQAPPPTPELARATPAPAAPNVRLMRPVEGPVAVGFNKGSGPSRNDGVDFASPAGASVVAAADGEVALVSQSLGGLGTIVLLRHPNDLLTVYGRIDEVTVRKGDTVQAGQRIGVVSNAAAPAEPRMHFEVRRGAESLDPMQFL